MTKGREKQNNNNMLVWLSDLTTVADMNKEYTVFSADMCVRMLGEGGGEEKLKSLNMLLPLGRTAACDLEKQSRVMGILHK